MFHFLFIYILLFGVDADFVRCRVIQEENSLVWHQQALGWINKYSGVAESNPDAIQLSDTEVPVVDIDAGVR